MAEAIEACIRGGEARRECLGVASKACHYD